MSKAAVKQNWKFVSK